MKEKDIDPEEAMEYTQTVFKKRGIKALDMARKEILQEKIESKEARQALSYFITEYWQDLARPSLLSLTCEAIGGKPESTIPIAIPMILISGAIDIHDDIIDQSKSKYGRPTVYGKHGRDISLLVGDALLFKGLMLLDNAAEREISEEKMRIIRTIVKNMFFELGDAEALELQFRNNLNVSPEEYLKVVRKKAADVEAHTRISAILGDASPEKVNALGEYGRILGMLIILRDDLIDVLDVEESCRRIKNEALPLPILYGLQQRAIKDRLRTILLKKTLTKKDIDTILKTIQKTNVFKNYAKLMNEMVKEAISKLRGENIQANTLRQLVMATLSPPVEIQT